MNRNPLLFVLAGTLLVYLGAAGSLVRRHRAERANTGVQMAVESDALGALAAGERVPFETALERAKAAGITALVISEESLGEAIVAGRATLTPGQGSSEVLPQERAAGQGFRTAPSIGPGYTIAVPDPTLRARIGRALRIRFGSLVQDGKNGGFLVPANDIGFVRGTPILLDDEIAGAARRAGMRIVARAGNPTGIGQEGVAATIRSLKAQGADVLLPLGDQVLGRRDAEDTTVATLRETGMLYASPEFAKLGGDVETLKAMPDAVIRLHSAQGAELDKLSPAGAVDRYVKAATERNMRLLLLRPLGGAGDRPLTGFFDFAGEITKGIGRNGLHLGAARPFTDPEPPRWAAPVIGLGTAIAIAGVAAALGLSGTLLVLAGALAAGTLVGALAPRLNELSALVATLVFPVAGPLAAFGLKAKWPLALALSTLVALAGGLAVAGLLNSLPYLVRAETFSGVKLAVFLPVVLIGAYAFARLADLRGSLKAPITWGTAGLGLLVLTVLLVMVARSGNDGPAGVSGGELAFRGLLEDLLPVRPRTKEFLIGFPALTVGFAWLSAVGYDVRRLDGRGGWVALLLLLGGIALTDVVNTFCHLHTPLSVSAMRVLLGFVFGVAIGSVLWLVLRPFLLAARAPRGDAAFGEASLNRA